MQVEIRAEDDAEGAIAETIERGLIAALRQNIPPSDGQPLTLVARDGAAIVGGLVGLTSYGWLLTKMLWIAEDFRNHGLGARLLAEAEAEARERGCHAAWLDTSSARAERLYLRLGYAPFGILENRPGDHPEGHRRAFLAKRLA